MPGPVPDDACYGPGDMDDGELGRRRRLAAGAIYGTVVYLTVLVLLKEDRTDPRGAAVILVGTALVFWLAHVYAHLVPWIAAEGRLGGDRLRETARDQFGILAAVVFPLIPLVLAMVGLMEDRAALRAAIGAGFLVLGAVALWEARVAGLGWARSIGVTAVLVASGIGLLWLEVVLH